MARETTKWPSTRWPITKIMSSDGCNGNRVPLEMGPWYDFREFGCHLGNVGKNHMCRCQCSHHFHRFEEALAGRSILDKSTVAIPRDIKVLLANIINTVVD